MKKFWLPFFAALLIVSSINAQNYKKVKIYLSDFNQIKEIVKAGIGIDHYSVNKDKSVNTFITDEEYTKLKSLGYKTEILIENWIEYYNNRQKPSENEIQAQMNRSKTQYGVSGFSYGSMGGYLTYAEVNAQLDTLRSKFPTFITKKTSIAKTAEGRDIYLVKISQNADVENTRPEVFYTALMHAREPEGMMQLFYFMYYLLENYNTDPVDKYIVDNRSLYFIPVFNPDGYEYNRISNPGGGGMWRKNRVKNSNSSNGVDLNRNFGPLEYWNAPNGGSSDVEGDDTYRGTAPFSEKETQAIKDFLAARKIKTSLNYHTYGNMLIYPYSALTYETPDSLIFREYALIMSGYTNSIYGTDMQTVGYSTRGSCDDYYYDGDLGNRPKIISMTPEVGDDEDGFWPTKERIIPVAIECLPQNIFIAFAAGAFLKPDNYTFSRAFFNPGETIKLKGTINNIGLSDAANISFKLSSLTSLAAADGADLKYSQVIPARTKINLQPEFSFTINNNAKPGDIFKLLFTTFVNGYTVSTDTISLKIGIPAYTLADSSSNISTYWDVTSTPTGAPKWEISTINPYSPPYCFTDSKNGNYANNSTVIMSLKNPVTLPAGFTSYLTFRTKYDIETDYDYGQVEISADSGKTWQALKGTYTKTAGVNSNQAGKPIYDGTRLNWVLEEMDLANFSGKQIIIRFKLVTDEYLTKDGWYLDDIAIYALTTVPVELASFTGSVEGKKVKLEWKTVTETNNYGFEIQREISGGKFFTLGFIKGHGTSAEINSYVFNDISPNDGNNRYRLKQIDFDNTFKLYEPVCVNFSKSLTFSLGQNYPNPFNPETVIEYNLPYAGNVSLKIFDVLGRELTSLISAEQKAGRHAVSFNASGFSSGIYYYKLQCGTFTQTRKMMLVK